MAIKDPKRLDDHYSQKARKEGYPARSVYKLEEIDQKYKLVQGGQRVLDLGCSPGSWTLYVAAKVGLKGRVVGLDLALPANSFPSNVNLIEADLLDNNIELVSGDGPFDLILSDMAPKTMGRRDVDQTRSLALVEIAWSWALQLLKPKGHFVFKVFQSQDADDFILQNLKTKFDSINRLKPKATRNQSLETFVVCRKYID